MSHYYVYILSCSDSTLYTGWTTNIHNRLVKHNKGLASKYTRARLPVRLVHVEEVASKSEALKREFAIKKLSRNEKMLLNKRYI